ncbi:MAG: DNA primase small subunit domain-containing protein [Thermoplasmata archaeon]
MSKDLPLEAPTLAWVQERFARYYHGRRIDPPPRFARREFAWFPFAAESSMRRHIAWGSADEFQQFVRREVPRHLYYSTAYYRLPNHPKMAEKEWQGADLVFDLDADHLRGASDQTYAEQLVQVKAGLLRLLDDFLFGDFGIDPDETEITFSGGRGYHVKVRSEGVLSLNSPERRDLVDYILGTGFDPLEVIEPPDRPSDPRSKEGARRIPAPWPDPEAPGWAGRTTRAILAVLDRWEREGVVSVAGELRAMGLPGARAARWAERLVEKGGIDRIRKSRRFDVFKETFPPDVLRAMVAQAAIEVQGETDAPVTTDIHRLIRLPSSLHGGTGFRVVPLDRDRLPDFDPLTDARAPLGDDPIERIEFRCNVAYPFRDHPVRGSVGATDELPTAIALFLVLRGEATPRPRPG